MTNSTQVQPTSDQRDTLVGGSALLVTTLFWGSMVPVVAVLLQWMDPFLITPARYFAASPVLLLMVVLVERKLPSLAGVPYWAVIKLGGLGMTGFATCYTFGIMLSDPISAAATLAMGPVVALIMGRIMYGQRVSGHMFIGVALAVTGGTMAAMGKPTGAADLGFRGGELLLILGTVCWTWYSMKAQEWIGPLGWHPFRISFFTGAAGAIWSFAIFAVIYVLGYATFPQTPPTGLIVFQFAWICAGGTAIAVGFWNFSVKKLGVSHASLFLNLIPVWAVVVSLFFDIYPSPLQLVGGALVISGVMWIQLKKG